MNTRINRSPEDQVMPGQLGLDVTPHSPADSTARFIDYLRSEPTPDEVAQELVLGYLSGCQARACLVSTIESDATLRLAGAFGVDARASARLGNASLWDSLPAASSIRGQRTIAISTPETLVREFPVMAEVVPGGHGLVSVPLMTATSTVGAVCICLKVDDARVLGVAARVLEAISDVYALYLMGTTQRSADPRIPTAKPVEGLTPDGPPAFTERQRQVLELLGEGMTYDQIATRIGYSHSTVRMELMRMYRVLGVSSRRDAISAASRLGFVDESRNIAASSFSH